MIEVKDIQKSIEERKSLFYAGAEINQEAYDFLCRQTPENIEMLFADMPPTKPKEPSHLYIHFECQRCFSPMTIGISKNQFKLCRCGGFPTLLERHSNIRPSDESGIIYALSFLDIEKGVKNLKGVCDDCIRSLRRQINDKYGEFYNDPLLWVNTHNSEKHSWQWDKVEKLFAYPHGYDKQPAGWKYCGVRIKSRDSKETTDYVDSDYYNWKNIMDKTVVEKRLKTTREILNELLGNINKTEETPAAFKKAISIAEVFIEGLASNINLSSLMEYLSKESGQLLENIKKKSSPSRTFNFGKYKGMSIHAVIEIDPEYIYWALSVVEGFTLTIDEQAHYNGEEWKHLVSPKGMKVSPEEPIEEEEDESYKTAVPLINEDDSSAHESPSF